MRFLIARFFYTDAVNTVIIFMGVYVTDEVGFGTQLASVVMLVAMSFAVVAGLIWGRVVDRIGPRPEVIAGGFLVGAGFIILSFTQSLWVFYVGTLVVSGGTSAAVGVPRTWAIIQPFTRMRG